MVRSILFVSCIFLAGCNDNSSTDGKLHIVTTTSIMEDTAKRVGGVHVRVDSLMGPGIDPHTYMPKPDDISKLHEADLILFHGLHLEGKMDDVLSKSPPKKAVAVCEKIERKKLKNGGDGPHDPHVWMDPALWCIVVGIVRDELIVSDPVHAEAYTKNAQDFIEEILKLHAENRHRFNELPADRRILVTSHDAFNYFGDAYGLQVNGLQGISTAAELGTREMEEMTDFLGLKKVPAVFGETSVPTKGLETVLTAVKKKYGHSVRLVGGDNALYSDALGEPGTPGETYLGMIRHNVTVIVNGLK